MASDGILSPYITSMTLLFILLILFGITMADHKEQSFQPTTSTDGALKRNSMEFTTRRHGIGNSKPDSTSESDSRTKAAAAHVPDPPGPRGNFRVRQSPLPWQERIFNASAHEVPSGPNPISNR